jgi:D-glycerate 3-kinase
LTGDALDRIARDLGLPVPFPSVEHYRRIAGAIAKRTSGGPLLAGICGPQGSGKSTMAAFVAALLEAEGLRTAILSLDDLYLDPEDRPTGIHPLFATRGVPGTHDPALGLDVIEGLFATGGAIPRFDKGLDRRCPEAAWDRFEGPADVVLFEGWCVGAAPQEEAALAVPVNRLEAEEDPDGRWRRHANACLAGPYRPLFDRLGFLVYLQAPSFDCVLGWRALQERKLRARTGGGMDEAALVRFIAHYERLTRHLAGTLPARADILVTLAETQEIAGLRETKVVVCDNYMD